MKVSQSRFISLFSSSDQPRIHSTYTESGKLFSKLDLKLPATEIFFRKISLGVYKSVQEYKFLFKFCFVQTRNVASSFALL